MNASGIFLCLGLLLSAPVLAQQATIDSATLRPGDTVTVSINATSGIQKLNALDITIKPLPFMPTWSVGSITQGWTVLTDPDNPWHVGLLSFNAVNGPGELLKLTLKTSATTDPGSYPVQALSFKTVQNGQDVDITAQTAPGSIVVPGLKGDVTEDGNITLADVVAALQIFIGSQATNSKIWAGDLNCKDGVDSVDVNRLFRRAVLSEPWPNCDGSWFRPDFTVTDVDFSPDGKSIIQAGGKYRVRSTATGDIIKTLDLPPTVQGPFIRYSPDGTRVVILGFGTIAFLSTEDYSVISAFDIPNTSYLGVRYRPDGNVISVNGTGVIYRFTEQSGLVSTSPSAPHGTAMSFDLSPDGASVVIGQGDGFISFYASETGTFEGFLPPQAFGGQDNYIFTVRYSSDGTRLAAGYRDAKVRLWNPLTKELLQTYSGFEREVSVVGFSSDNARVLAVGIDNTGPKLKAWDALSNSFLNIVPLKGGSTASFSPLEDKVAYASSNGIGLSFTR